MTTSLRFGVTPAGAARLRRIARVWVLVVLVLTAGMAARRVWGAPEVTQSWEPMAWLAAVGLLLVPAVMMWWSDAITGAWATLSASRCT